MRGTPRPPKTNLSPWSKRHRPPVGPRTLSPIAVEVAAVLEAAGYRLLTRGWPTFLAVRGNEVRAVVVRRCPTTKGLDDYQRQVNAVLRRHGLMMEVLHPGNREEWVQGHNRETGGR